MKRIIDISEEIYKDCENPINKLEEIILASTPLNECEAEDCISRNKAKQTACNITAEYDTETIHIDRLIDELDNLPSSYPKCDKTVEAIPKEQIDKMIAEIEDNFYDTNYFQSVRATKDEILEVIHKYCDKGANNE